MSLEQILLIIFLVVLPLIQFLMRMIREHSRPPNQAEGPARPTSARTPRHQGSGGMTTPARNERTPVGGTAGRGWRPSTTAVANRKPIDLRSAVVLMTVIGPSRAASPHDWPELR